MKPFLKWVGGKSRSAVSIVEQFPGRMSTYSEPFVGSGAVFFELWSQGVLNSKSRVVLNDSNRELMATYSAVRDNLSMVIAKLKMHCRGHAVDEDWFYKVRAADPWSTFHTELAARMIYLNKTCFNGLYRVNKRGEFNVPKGKYANPNILDESNLRACSEALQNVELSTFDFRGFEISGAMKGIKNIYFDPPYAPTKGSPDSFTAYGVDGFSSTDHTELAEQVQRLSKRATCIVSNSDTSFVRKLYKGARITKLKVNRTINSDALKRGKVGELLINV